MFSVGAVAPADVGVSTVARAQYFVFHVSSQKCKDCRRRYRPTFGLCSGLANQSGSHSLHTNVEVHVFLHSCII